MGRILCVDYGRTRVGLAVSDPLGHTAQPFDVVERPKKGSLIDKVVDVAREVGAQEIVVGLPLKMDGTSGVAADAVRQFADALSERVDVPVVLFDERLSTVEATRRMRAAGVRSRQQRGVVDKVAAAVVLRTYLEQRQPRDVPLDEADAPEPLEVEPKLDRPHEAPGGKASAKRRHADKRAKRRSRRQAWRRDVDEG